jgi:AmmeMemoRadiSam system protein B
MPVCLFSGGVLLVMSGLLRGIVDPLGFPTTREQSEAVIEHSLRCRMVEGVQEIPPNTVMVAGISPHDDHIYAGPLYLPVMEHLTAPHLILIGVFHKAGQSGVKDVLVFDGFDAWKGPGGAVQVDIPFRSAVLERLPSGSSVVSNEYHGTEHSLEAFLGFIQHFDANASILPILVAPMRWERMDELARALARTVASLMKEKSWVLGRDVQILISSDAVHYGDQGWGGKDYAPFGTGVEGLAGAKERDVGLVREHLAGAIEPSRLEKLLSLLVEEEDILIYRITWCGRFSVPFGVDLTFHLSRELGLGVPEGSFLGYGTSVEMGELPLRDTGLGVTAPANLHHWVSYATVGYFAPLEHSGE